MSNNSNFISNSFNNSIIDLMSCTSDSYPIGPVGNSVTDGLIYGSFICVSDLLVQFTSNQTDNTTVLKSTGNCLFPIEMSGNNVPNTFLITGNNQTSSGGSNITTNQITNSGFTYSNVPSGDNGSYLNFLCISPRPEYFKPKVPFITTGGPFISWNNSSLTLTYTNSGNITFSDLSSISDISMSLLSGGGGGGGGGSGGPITDYTTTYVGGGGGGGGSSTLVTLDSFDKSKINLNTQYICSVGAGSRGGWGGNSGSSSTLAHGRNGSDGRASWIGIRSHDVLITTGPGAGGAGGTNTIDQNIPANGGGGGGGTNSTTGGKSGVDGADFSKNVTTYYAAGGGGGKYHDGNKVGRGGDGNVNYGSGGDGSGGSSSSGNPGTSGVSGIFSVGDNITTSEWGGGGGGGGGGFCDSSGNGSGGGPGGDGASGYIQITLTFNT